MRYKVVETMTVTEEALEAILNRWVLEGWTLDSVQFVKSDASRRPTMAFLFFCREDHDEPET
ncbi:MAG: DUF4177 domain-containing protein [Myxococcales bacterium]|nr:DUF4177 domain-containing protein [Myxococcales bacterium]